MSTTTCLVVGPAEHGVTAAALAQAHALGADGPVVVSRHPERPGAAELLDAVRGAAPGTVSVHVTDKLFGRTPEEAADVVVALAQARPLVLSLHDLPQASDGPVNAGRRAAAYRRMAQAAAAVVVASHHEARLLAACGVDAAPSVVPLPVPDLAAAAPAADESAVPQAVAVLGYLYPGKGHEVVLAAIDVLPAGVGLTAWGRASDGHEDLVAALTATAASLDRPFHLSGYVPDDDLPGLLRSPVLPIAPHEHLSASGSINAWIGAGRRPLVPRSDYALELLERSPGCVWLYDDLRTALAQAWADPRATWAAGGVPAALGPAATAALLRAVLDRVGAA